MRISRAFTATILSLGILIFSLFVLPKNALAIPVGHAKCGTGTNCLNPTYPTCQQGCNANQTDCGFNCPGGGGGTVSGGQQCISCQNDGGGAMPVYIISIQPTHTPLYMQ